MLTDDVLVELPGNVRWNQLLGIGMLGGIGFTVSLFITELAFTDPNRIAEAKIGVLAASLLSGVIGLTYLWLSTTAEPHNRNAEPAPPI